MILATLAVHAACLVALPFIFAAIVSDVRGAWDDLKAA